MAKKQSRIPANLQPWIDARRKFHLSHEHVQMARELGLNRKKLGKLDNHDQEPWKLPLPEFIGELYSKRCGKGEAGCREKYRGDRRGEAGEEAGEEPPATHAR